MPFDKSLFNRVLDVCALRIPVKRCSEFMKTLRGSLLNYPRQRNIVSDPDVGAAAGVVGDAMATKLLLLSDKISSPAQLPPAEAQFVSHAGVPQTTFRLVLDYTYFSAEEVLKELLPSDVEAPASFETPSPLAPNSRTSHSRGPAAAGTAAPAACCPPPRACAAS